MVSELRAASHTDAQALGKGISVILQGCPLKLNVIIS